MMKRAVIHCMCVVLAIYVEGKLELFYCLNRLSGKHGYLPEARISQGSKEMQLIVKDGVIKGIV